MGHTDRFSADKMFRGINRADVTHMHFGGGTNGFMDINLSRQRGKWKKQKCKACLWCWPHLKGLEGHACYYEASPFFHAPLTLKERPVMPLSSP